ncbi:MAG: hypothetical protein QOE77_2536 [Blastocatellia bacterium]|nr:hypothetical protein [Blastocatellia bacterium]
MATLSCGLTGPKTFRSCTNLLANRFRESHAGCPGVIRTTQSRKLKYLCCRDRNAGRATLSMVSESSAPAAGTSAAWELTSLIAFIKWRTWAIGSGAVRPDRELLRERPVSGTFCIGTTWSAASRDSLVAAGNVPSQRVAEKAGAVKEAILRKRIRLHGEPVDAVLYSLVAEDL